MLTVHPTILEDVLSITRDSQIHWEKLRGKTVLVTGASGLIGSYVVYTLLCLNDREKMDITVIGLVRNRTKAERQFSTLLDRSDFLLLVQQVEDNISYHDVVHYIIHTASPTSPRSFVTDPIGVIKANTFGTNNLLEYSCTSHLEGFLYISSREIYGESVSEMEHCSENEYGVVDPVLIRSCYPESKRLGETLCVCYCSQYNLPVKIVRLAHVYGPDYNLDNGRVWGDFVTSVITNQNIVLKSEGLTRLAFTYVSDAVSGIFLVLLNGTEMVYNISDTSEILSVYDLAEMILSLVPDNTLRIVQDLSSDTSGYLKNKVPFLDATRIKMLGWKPHITLKEGFSRTIYYGSTCPTYSGKEKIDLSPS